MSAPFDTLQLARGFEAAGFLLDHANKMATAVAQATIGADLATNAAGRGVRRSAAPKRARLGDSMSDPRTPMVHLRDRQEGRELQLHRPIPAGKRLLSPRECQFSLAAWQRDRTFVTCAPSVASTPISDFSRSHPGARRLDAFQTIAR